MGWDSKASPCDVMVIALKFLKFIYFSEKDCKKHSDSRSTGWKPHGGAAVWEVSPGAEEAAFQGLTLPGGQLPVLATPSDVHKGLSATHPATAHFQGVAARMHSTAGQVSSESKT